MQTRPNVLCISIDSLRADFAPFSSDRSRIAPAPDEFVENATCYRNAITPSTWTLPVHTSIFTGLYPPEHGLFHRGVELGDHPTFPELLHDEGYETRSYYRNGWLDVGGLQRGIEHRHRVESTNAWADRFVRIADRITPTTGDYFDATRDALDGTDGDAAVITKAEAGLSAAESPFCWFVHLNDAHWPYSPPGTHRQQRSGRSRLAALWNRIYWQEQVYRNRQRTWTGKWSPPERQAGILRECYRGAVAHVHGLVGRLLSTLDEQGILPETIVAVFGDHGDAFGETGPFGHHFSVDDVVIRVPLLLYDPTDRLRTDHLERPVNLNDLYPTLLELCDITPPETNSRSLLSDAAREVAFTYYEYTDELARNANADLGAVSADALPPRRQYRAWASPERSVTWYPERDRWNGNDHDLRAELRRHTERLVPIQPQ